MESLLSFIADREFLSPTAMRARSWGRACSPGWLFCRAQRGSCLSITLVLPFSCPSASHTAAASLSGGTESFGKELNRASLSSVRHKASKITPSLRCEESGPPRTSPGAIVPFPSGCRVKRQAGLVFFVQTALLTRKARPVCEEEKACNL